MSDSAQGDISRCGDKRKALKPEKMAGKEKSQKKPWGTDGPPPPEWIEVNIKENIIDGSRWRERRKQSEWVRGLPVTG
jgi:hypothetical protein